MVELLECCTSVLSVVLLIPSWLKVCLFGDFVLTTSVWCSSFLVSDSSCRCGPSHHTCNFVILLLRFVSVLGIHWSDVRDLRSWNNVCTFYTGLMLFLRRLSFRYPYILCTHDDYSLAFFGEVGCFLAILDQGLAYVLGWISAGMVGSQIFLLLS